VDFAEEQRKPTKHLVAFSVVVVLHILLGYALVSGLARKVVEVVKAPIETKIIEEVKPPPPPPEALPPPPKLQAPPPSFVPPPEVAVAPPVSNAPVITTTGVAPPPAQVSLAPSPASAAPAQPVRVPPQVNFNRDCARPEYPAAAARAEATGASVIAAFVDLNGRVTQARVERSSGSTREHKLLDRAALEAIAGSCKFKPGTVDGKPEPLWTQVEYVWKLD